MLGMTNSRMNTYIYPPLLITSSDANGFLTKTTDKDIYTFVNNGSVTLVTHDLDRHPSNVNNTVYYMIVGGGGGGGASSYIKNNDSYKKAFGSGGGGGGIKFGSIKLCTKEPIQVITANLGMGGENILSSDSYTFLDSPGSNGGDSSLTADNITYSVSGGFGGTTFFGGKSGNMTYGGVATPDFFTGGAGGGSDMDIGSIAVNGNGANGANGIKFDYIDLFFGGGGGGGNSPFINSFPGIGGRGGGGKGGEISKDFAEDGTNNTGGGGGGGGIIGSGRGGSGCVIIWVNK